MSQCQWPWWLMISHGSGPSECIVLGIKMDEIRKGWDFSWDERWWCGWKGGLTKTPLSKKTRVKSGTFINQLPHDIKTLPRRNDTRLAPVLGVFNLTSNLYTIFFYLIIPKASRCYPTKYPSIKLFYITGRATYTHQKSSCMIRNILLWHWWKIEAAPTLEIIKGNHI